MFTDNPFPCIGHWAHNSIVISTYCVKFPHLQNKDRYCTVSKTGLLSIEAVSVNALSHSILTEMFSREWPIVGACRCSQCLIIIFLPVEMLFDAGSHADRRWHWHNTATMDNRRKYSTNGARRPMRLGRQPLIVCTRVHKMKRYCTWIWRRCRSSVLVNEESAKAVNSTFEPCWPCS